MGGGSGDYKTKLNCFLYHQFLQKDFDILVLDIIPKKSYSEL